MSGAGDQAGTFSPAQQVAANVAREKHRTGLSLSQIARYAELHRTHVFLILRGKRDIHISTLVKLASALGVKPGVLLEGVEWEPGSRGLMGTFTHMESAEERTEGSDIQGAS